MANFAGLKAEVQTNIIDLPPAVLANLGTYVNRAIRAAERQYNFKYMEQSVQFTTTPSSLVLGTIANFKEERGRGSYVLQQFAPAYGLYKSTESGQELRTFTLNTTFPDQPHFVRLISLDQNNVATYQVYPYPDANSDWSDGNYRIVIPYHGYSPALVADGDSTWLTVNAEEYVIEQATAFGFQANWDQQQMAVWLQRADYHFKEIKLTDKKQRIAGVDTLVVNFEGANQGMVQR